MTVREDIRFVLAGLGVLADRLPNNEALVVCGMMHQLLAINRMVNDDNKTMVNESKEH